MSRNDPINEILSKIVMIMILMLGVIHKGRPHEGARTKSIAVTKLLKLLFNNFALDKHALHYALCLL